jgi:hypothetical protein
MQQVWRCEGDIPTLIDSPYGGDALTTLETISRDHTQCGKPVSEALTFCSGIAPIRRAMPWLNRCA